MLHAWALRRDFGDQRGEAFVEADHLVLGVPDDPRDLLWEEPWVDGVGDAPMPEIA